MDKSARQGSGVGKGSGNACLYSFFQADMRSMHENGNRYVSKQGFTGIYC